MKPIVEDSTNMHVGVPVNLEEWSGMKIVHNSNMMKAHDKTNRMQMIEYYSGDW